VQGLAFKTNPEFVLLFDLVPAPAGAHCHFPAILRDVLFVDGKHTLIAKSDWPEFARQQVELLVNEGLPRAEAERLYGI
jgi:hypothetical protein